MKKLFRLMVALIICLTLISINPSGTQADSPSPVGTIATESDALSLSSAPVPERAPGTGDDTVSSDTETVADSALSSDVLAAPEGAPEQASDGRSDIRDKASTEDASRDLGSTGQLTEAVTCGEPSMSDHELLSSTGLDASGSSISVTAAWTTDGRGNRQSTFSPGDSILYYGYVSNRTGRTTTVYLSWSVDGPCGSIASWSGNLDTGTGTRWWRLPARIPGSACGGTYTYRLSVTYNGQTSTQSTTFTVRGAEGSVSVASAWTTDGSGNRKSTFDSGDSILYYGKVTNTTGRTATAYFTWSVDGPCGSIASWSGNLDTGSGTWWWRLPARIPNSACAGNYTYRLSVTHSGHTSTRSTTFTVRGAEGSVSAASAWTTDSSGNRKSTFNCGDSIQYYGTVCNTTGRTATAYFRWSVDGPCGSIASWSGNLNTGSGTWRWRLPTRIPSSACGGTYTYRLSVTYNGQISTQSTTFTVRGDEGSVTATAAWTTDGSGNRKSTFNSGDSIQYYGNVRNTTGRTATAYFRWSVDGPCGSIASWSGNLDTGSGTWSWRLPSTVPSTACAGTYTYRLSVTYNGRTSSQSATFTVSANPRKVVLDPGHGWWTGTQIDPGCVSNSMAEKDVVLDIAGRAAAILRGRGIEVLMTRNGDDYHHSLSYAAAYANRAEPDLVVSIHANAGGGSGTEGWYTVGKSTDDRSKELAGLLASRISARLSIRNRGTKPETANRHGRLYIHDMDAPAALIETAFLDNDNDAGLLRTRRQDFAQAIADAVLAFFDR